MCSYLLLRTGFLSQTYWETLQERLLFASLRGGTLLQLVAVDA